MAVHDSENLLDLLILDMIALHGAMDDFTLSRRLHCPLSFLLDRLEQLLTEGYLIPTPEGLRLSETGKSARVPLAFYRASAERPAAAAPDAFDWTQPYIPEAGWLD